MATTTNEKAITLKDLVKAHQRGHDEVEELKGKVNELVTTGGEPNVITGIKVNGMAQTITDKAVDLTMPTKVSDLDNDEYFVTYDEAESMVNSSINTTIAKKSHASFLKVDSVPNPADAQSNVLYLVMNEESGHYDIYAKVVNGPSNGKFVDVYGIEVADGADKVGITFAGGGMKRTNNIPKDSLMSQVVAMLNENGKSYGMVYDYNAASGEFTVTESDGSKNPVIVSMNGETLTQVITAEMVRLDDTTVDLSAYETAEQTGTKLNGKVDKEEGKGLSEANFTAAEKEKLAGIVFATYEEVAAALDAIYGPEDSTEEYYAEPGEVVGEVTPA